MWFQKHRENWTTLKMKNPKQIHQLEVRSGKLEVGRQKSNSMKILKIITVINTQFTFLAPSPLERVGERKKQINL